MNITTCDGTIIFTIAPFPAVQNDATILQHLLDETVMFDNLLQGDILLLDRGFRDVVQAVERKGLVVKMPSLIQAGTGKKGQLLTKDANRSRLVTALRFVVETRNGHLKIIWKIFNTILSAYSQVHLSTDVEICYALINKYYGTFESNRGNAIEVANRMISKLDEENLVGNVVTTDRFQKHIKDFTPFNDFDELPQLSKRNLFFISLGEYSIKQAESYTQVHVKQNDNQFLVWACPEEVCRSSFPSFWENHEPALYITKLNSRFRSNKIHTTYVLIDCNGVDERAVLGYYCDCYNGWRTLGCCSHVMTLIAFLLVTKGKDIADPSGFLNNIFDV